MDQVTTLFEQLPIGAYRSSLDGRQLRANAALVRLNGYDNERQMLQAVNDIGRECYVDPQRRAEFARLMQRDGAVVDFVSEIYRHRTRERIWVRENAHLVRDAAGRVLCYEGTVEDVSATHRAELALQASERRFRALTEHSQQLTLLCDAQGVVRYASPAARQLLGHEPQAVVHTKVLEWLHPDDQAEAQAELASVLAMRPHGERETVCRARHADGQWRHVAILANNCLSDPAVAGVVLNVRDVSERVRAEEALRTLNAQLEQRVQQRTAELVRARDEAEAASRAKTEFLSRMSHELRTPMHAILGFAQVMLADPAWAAADTPRSHLGQILQAGQQLLGLIDGLLDLARIDAGELPLQLEAVEVAPLLQQCLHSSAALARDHEVKLPEVAAAPLCVRADRARLEQVLLELVANAIKHNRRGGCVELQVEPVAAGVRIVVGDTGPGLDAAQQQQVFQVFERLGGWGQVQGAGIGLALSKRLIELMHGHIGLHSQPGVGSRFWVQLDGAGAAAAAAPAAPCSGTVLYIEDNPVNQMLMEAMLQQGTRARMLRAELPEAGLELARTQRPDLILLDIQLPGIDGFEVLRRLRGDAATRDIAVVAVSANALRADIQRGLAAGFADYLTKPIDQQLLVATLQRLLPCRHAAQ
jgi:PAS domain S-box-containing protein